MMETAKLEQIYATKMRWLSMGLEISRSVEIVAIELKTPEQNRVD